MSTPHEIPIPPAKGLMDFTTDAPRFKLGQRVKTRPAQAGDSTAAADKTGVITGRRLQVLIVDADPGYEPVINHYGWRYSFKPDEESRQYSGVPERVLIDAENEAAQ